MPSKSHPIFPLVTTLLVLALVLGFSTVTFAGDDRAPGQDAVSRDAPRNADGEVPRDGAKAGRVYELNGATISWDLDSRRFHPPSAQQAAALAREFHEWMEALLADDEKDDEKALPFSEEIVVEELAGGVRKARLPAYLINVAMVRVDQDGRLAGTCVEAPANPARVLEATAGASGEAWR